jgi:hypothetical protein
MQHTTHLTLFAGFGQQRESLGFGTHANVEALGAALAIRWRAHHLRGNMFCDERLDISMRESSNACYLDGGNQKDSLSLAITGFFVILCATTKPSTRSYAHQQYSQSEPGAIRV